MNTKLKILGSLLGIFLLGAGTGWMARTSLASPKLTALEPTAEWPRRTLENYRERLSLSPDQMRELASVFKQTGDALRVLRAEMAGRIAATIKSNSQQVANVLTAEQLPAFQKIIQEAQEQRERAAEKQKLPAHD